MKRKNVMLLKKAALCFLMLSLMLGGCGGSAKNSASESRDYSAENSFQGEPSAAYEADEDMEEEYTEEEYTEGYDPDDSALAMGDYSQTAASAASKDTGGTAAPENGGEGSTELPSSNRKIVYTGNISLQTLEYDKSSQSIHDKINKYGGFVENEDTFNEDPYWYYKNRTGAAANRTKRNLNITARIPAEKFNAFMKDLEEDGQVINTSVNARNISVQYATHDASRKALEIEQGRLLEMMEKAETVEEMIAVEERLTEVERELNDEKTQLSAMDRDVGFSTIYISLQEVFEYSETVVEVSYGEQLKRAFGRACEGFVTFWKDLILFIVETFPFLIMLGVIITVIVKLIRRGRRRRLEKRVRMEEQRRAAMKAGAGLTADSGLTGDAGPKAGREPEAGGGLKAGREPEADGGPAADGSSKADVKRT